MARPKRSHDWLNLPAARARLRELERTLTALESERQLLQRVLGGHGSTPSSQATPGLRRRPGRPPGRGGPSLLDAIADVMAKDSSSKGWGVSELRDELAKRLPERMAVSNASALISSALIQALRAKKPRFIGMGGGGPGKARRYRLAS